MVIRHPNADAKCVEECLIPENYRKEIHIDSIFIILILENLKCFVIIFLLKTYIKLSIVKKILDNIILIYTNS